MTILLDAIRRSAGAAPGAPPPLPFAAAGPDFPDRPNAPPEAGERPWAWALLGAVLAAGGVALGVAAARLAAPADGGAAAAPPSADVAPPPSAAPGPAAVAYAPPPAESAAVHTETVAPLSSSRSATAPARAPGDASAPDDLSAAPPPRPTAPSVREPAAPGVRRTVPPLILEVDGSGATRRVPTTATAASSSDGILTITPLEGGFAAAFGPIETRDGDVWRPVAAGERVRVGAEIRAAPGARASIELPGAVLDLAGGAHIRIARLQRSGDRTEVGFHLSEGEAALRVDDGATASLSTDGLIASAPAGRYLVRASPQRQEVRVDAGGLVLQNTAGGSLVVPSGAAGVLEGGALRLDSTERAP